MAIFARRVIQQMINENASFLTKEQIDQQIARLDSNKFESIAAEWEVVILNIFSKLGSVEHEPNLQGTSRIDLLFTHRDDQSQFLADITSVSDEKYEDKNPYKAFGIELVQQVRRAGLKPDHFHYSVGAHPFTGLETKLMLPSRQDFVGEIFNSQFKTFLGEIKEDREQERSLHISSIKTDIQIDYDPRRTGLSAGCYVYSLSTSKTQNPVYNALKSKQRQLKKVQFAGQTGIILCDGGSDMFSAKPGGQHGPYFNAAQAIKEFLRQNQSIDFVLTVSVDFPKRGLSRTNTKGPFRKVKVEVHPNTNFASCSVSLQNSLAQLEQYFPEPFNVPDGARETIRHGFRPKKARPLNKYLFVSGSEIRLWANNLFELLNGSITQDKFWELSSLKDCYFGSTNTSNPFEHFYRLKKRLIEVRVEEEHDFTYLVFRFDGPDPAISNFVNPKRDHTEKDRGTKTELRIGK